MSADGSITLPFGGAEQRFRLGIDQLRELQDAVNVPRARAGVAPVGPSQILAGLGSGTWWIDDCRETIRIGLIGGGMEPMRALLLTQRYVEDRPMRESLPIARAVLLAALIGDPDDQVARGNGTAEKAKTEAAGASPSPSSTRSAEPLAGAPAT